MSIRTLTLREALDQLGVQLRELLSHPEATQQDKASIVLANISLAEIRRRHMPRWTPLDPATLPAGRVQTFAPVSGLPKGHLLDWEEGQGVAS